MEKLLIISVKKTVLGLAFSMLMVLNISAAEQGHETTTDKSYFEILGDMIQNSTTPALDKIVGIHAGRCFSQYNPDRPYGAGLKMRKRTQDVGPIGDPYPKYEFLFITDSTPSYFDDLNDSYFSSDNSFYVRYYPSTGAGYDSPENYEYQFGFDGEYILMQINYEEEVHKRCYYFLPNSVENTPNF